MGSLVIITGTPGVGKTSVLNKLVKEAEKEKEEAAEPQTKAEEDSKDETEAKAETEEVKKDAPKAKTEENDTEPAT